MLFFNNLSANTFGFNSVPATEFSGMEFLKSCILSGYNFFYGSLGVSLFNLFYLYMNPYISINSFNNISLNFLSGVDENIKKEKIHVTDNYNLVYGELLCRLT